jgi:hypothetical protein
MDRRSCPDWLNQVWDQLYNEHAAQIVNQPEIHTLIQTQGKLEEKLKSELTFSQFQSVLEWEEVMNQRLTKEIELMYLAGLKSGMRISQELQNFIAD